MTRDDSHTLDISVVVPVHNEAENIRPQVEEIFAALEDTHPALEVIYVDDGSTDDTPHVLREELARRRGRLRVLRHPTVLGQSTAIHTGVSAARNPWIVTLDGDRQNDPADIPGLLEEVRRSGGARLMVAGHRVERRDTWIRRVSSRIANGLRARLLRDRTPDTGCGLKVFPRDLFLALPYFDHMHRFLSALVLRQGGEVRSVPVSHRPRPAGRSKYGLHNRLWVGIVDMMGVAWLQRREKRPPRTVEITAENRAQATHPGERR